MLERTRNTRIVDCRALTLLASSFLSLFTPAAAQDSASDSLGNLRFHVQTLEIPANEYDALAKNWTVSGSAGTITQVQRKNNAPKSGVVPASFESPVTRSSIQAFSQLDSSRVAQLVKENKTISPPKIIHAQEALSVPFSEAEQYTVSYKSQLDSEGNPTGEMEPVVLTIQPGMQLQLGGKFVDDRRKLQLRLKYQFASVQGSDPFTLETSSGNFEVQQPNLSSSMMETSINVDPNKTFALCCGPVTRTVTTQKPVPVIGKVPLLGGLFKRSTLTNEEYYVLFLAHCETLY